MLPKLINSEAWFKYLCAELDAAAYAHNSFDVPRIYTWRLVCLCQGRVKLLCLSDHWEKWARRCISGIFWCQQVTVMIRFLVSTLLMHNSVSRACVWTLTLRQQQSRLELYICTTKIFSNLFCHSFLHLLSWYSKKPKTQSEQAD